MGELGLPATTTTRSLEKPAKLTEHGVHINFEGHIASFYVYS